MEAVLVHAADVKNWSKSNLRAISCTSKFKIYRIREGTEGDYKCSSTHSHPWCYEWVGGVRHDRGALPQRKTAGTNSTEGWVDFSSCLGWYEEYCPHRGFKPRSSNPKRVATQPPVSVNELFNELIILARRRYIYTWFRKGLGSIQFPIRMFHRILSGRRPTGLANSHIHLMPGSRISGALRTISRSDAATEAASFCRASMLYEARILQIDNSVLWTTTFNADTNTKFFGNPWNRFLYAKQFWRTKLNLVI